MKQLSPRLLRISVLAVALLGLTVCTDASTVDLLEVDATGVLFGVVYLDQNSNETLDAQDTPMKSITVVLSSGRGTMVREAVTDTLGLFRMIDVPVGTYRLAVDGLSLGDSLHVNTTAGERITISRGDTTQINFGTTFPVLTVEEVLLADPGQRVVTSGIALNARIPFGDGRVHLMGVSGSLRAIDVARATLNVGDSVRFQGRTARDAGRPVLQDVTPIVLVGQATIPVPVVTTTGVAAHAQAGDLDAALVRIQTAEILDTATVAGDFHFTIDDGSGPLKVALQSFLQANTSVIRPDTIIRVDQVTGLLVPAIDPLGNTNWKLFPRGLGELTLGVKTVDLALTVGADDLVGRSGDTVNIYVALANTGGLPATEVQVVDSLPTGLALLSSSATRGSYNASTGTWTVGTVPGNASDTLRLKARITTGALGLVTNVARLRPLVNEADVNPANNLASVTINVVTQILADIAVEVTSNHAVATSGDTIALTVLTINNGPFRATQVQIADTLPAELVFVSADASRGSYDPVTHLWTIDTLHAGSSQQLSIQARVSVTADTTAINNSWLIPLTAETDTVPSNDMGTATLRVLAPQGTPAPTAGRVPMASLDQLLGRDRSRDGLRSEAISSATSSAASSWVPSKGTVIRTNASSVRRFNAASRSRSNFTRYSLWATRPLPWYQ